MPNTDIKVRGYTTPADGDSFEKGGREKSYPNGILVTAAALWQRWAFHEKGPNFAKTSAEQFEKLYGLKGIASGLKKKYPGAKKQALTKPGEDIQKIGNGSHAELNYMQLRRMAEVVDLPVGLFLLFTNLVSKERRVEKDIEDNKLSQSAKKDELMDLVNKIELFAIEARRIIENSKETDDIFFEIIENVDNVKGSKHQARPGEEIYLARLEVLKLLRDACKISSN